MIPPDKLEKMKEILNQGQMLSPRSELINCDLDALRLVSRADNTKFMISKHKLQSFYIDRYCGMGKAFDELTPEEHQENYDAYIENELRIAQDILDGERDPNEISDR